MTAEKKKQRDELDAKDKRIDALIARTDRLLRELNATVADMKSTLTAGQADVDEQKDISARERRG